MASLLRVSIVAALVTTGCAPAMRAPGPVRSSPTLSVPHAPFATRAGNLWVIFLDDLHVDFRNTGRVRELLTRIADELIQEGDVFGIVSSGPSALVVDLTPRRELLNTAVARASGAALRPSDILSPTTAAGASNEMHYRVKVSLSTAYAVMTRLEDVRDRRKAFIYVSNGYNVTASPKAEPTSGSINPFHKPGNAYTVADLQDQVSELVRQAKQAQVTIFAVDPRALAAQDAIDQKLDGGTWQQFWLTTRASLRALSERTGGYALLDEADLADGLARIGRVMRN
jgi:VWFA-related protein